MSSKQNHYFFLCPLLFVLLANLLCSWQQEVLLLIQESLLGNSFSEGKKKRPFYTIHVLLELLRFIISFSICRYCVYLSI